MSKDKAADEEATRAGESPVEEDAATPPHRHDDLGEPGDPFPRHSPFYIGFFGGLGALLAFWLGSQLLAIKLDRSS